MSVLLTTRCVLTSARTLVVTTSAYVLMDVIRQDILVTSLTKVSPNAYDSLVFLNKYKVFRNYMHNNMYINVTIPFCLLDSEQPQTSEAVSVETTEPLTTVRPTTATSPTTTVAPTTRAPTVPPVVVRVLQLTQSEGTFSAPRWPRSYPQNIDYHWEITCAKDHIVQIDFSQAPFGIAGQMPNCSVDWIEVRNKNNIGSVLGRFCGLNVPPVVSSASNVALVSFHAGPVHSSVYKGFNASYKCVSKCPSIEIPKTMPECGGYLKGNSGMITSPNYPVTYNRNEYCEWIIEVPDCHKAIEINFVSFSVAGRMPDCPKDRLFVDDGLEKSSNSKGPFCHLTTPEPITTTSNVARLRFNAGPKHGPRRTGFSLRFQAIDK